MSIQPYPGGQEADIWVLAGQSNMQGAGIISREYRANPKVMVYDLGGEWLPATPPTHRMMASKAPVFKRLLFKNIPDLTEENWPRRVKEFMAKPWGGVGPDLSFAERIAEVTGHNVGLVPCAFGGTSMADWDSSGRDKGGETLYGNMMERIRSVGGRIKGILWYQGESDAMSPETVRSFEDNFLNLVDNIRRDTGYPELPFLYVQICRYNLQNLDYGVYWETAREIQRTAAGKRKNLWMVSSVDLPMDDLAHVSESGQERLGRRLAEVALTHVYGLKDHGTPIDYLSCEILPANTPLHHSLRVRFSGVTGRLQAPGRVAGFEIRSDDPKRDGPVVYKAELDPNDPAAVLVWYSKEITVPVRLYYAPGLVPYVNLADSLDMGVPGFGPVTIEPRR